MTYIKEKTLPCTHGSVFSLMYVISIKGYWTMYYKIGWWVALCVMNKWPCIKIRMNTVLYRICYWSSGKMARWADFLLWYSVFGYIFLIFSQLPAEKKDMHKSSIITNVCSFFFCHSFSKIESKALNWTFIYNSFAVLLLHK